MAVVVWRLKFLKCRKSVPVRMAPIPISPALIKPPTARTISLRLTFTVSIQGILFFGKPIHSVCIARRLIAVCEHSFCGDVGVCIIIDSTFGCICPDGGISSRCSASINTGLRKHLSDLERQRELFVFQSRIVWAVSTMVYAIHCREPVSVQVASQAHDVKLLEVRIKAVGKSGEKVTHSIESRYGSLSRYFLS